MVSILRATILEMPLTGKSLGLAFDPYPLGSDANLLYDGFGSVGFCENARPIRYSFGTDALRSDAKTLHTYQPGLEEVLSKNLRKVI